MIAVPHTGRPIPPQWTWGFANLHPPMNFNTNFLALYGRPIDEARNTFARLALEQEAKYLFMLGEDNIPPPFTIRQLIFDMEQDPDLMVVGGIYCHKAKPTNPMIFRGNGAGCYWDWKVGELFEVSGLGMDCTLVRTELFNKLPQPWFKTVDNIESTRDYIPSGDSWTEDLYFCEQVTKAGFKIMADASVMCDHIDMQTGESTKLPEGSKPTRRYVFPAKELKGVDLGCGDSHQQIEGVHLMRVDIRDDVGPDFRCNVAQTPFATGEFDLVYSSHTLEHFSRDLVDKVLDEWVRILKPAGEFRLVVPNVKWAAERLLAGEMSEDIYNVLYGAQTYDENFHKMGFTPDLLVGMLKARGFERIDVELINYHIALRAWRVPPKAVHDKPDIPVAYQPAATPGDPSKYKPKAAPKVTVNQIVKASPKKARKKARRGVTRQKAA